MVPTVVRTDEPKDCSRAGLVRGALIVPLGRGPAMLCGRCALRLGFASCTVVGCEVLVCGTSRAYVGPPTVAHGRCMMCVWLLV